MLTEVQPGQDDLRGGSRYPDSNDGTAGSPSARSCRSSSRPACLRLVTAAGAAAGRGRTTLHACDYATLDRAGRVQLPRQMTRRLGMRDRVELQEEPDHIGVWPDEAADQQRE